MSKLSIFDSAWTDLVFEGRNKDYGAYQLRKENPRTMIISLFSAFALMGIAIAVPSVVGYFTPPQITADMPELPPPTVFEFKKQDLQVEQPKETPVKPPVSAPAATPPVGTLANVQVTQNPVNTPEPTMNTAPVVDVPTGPTGPSTNTTGIPGPPSTNKESEETPDGPLNLAAADVKPEFPGGMDKFYKYVGRNFKAPEDDRAAGTALKVIVYFVVEKDGSMTDIKVLRNPGYGMDQEAIRVLKSITLKWKPGKYRGNDVRIAYTLPITVQAPQ